MLLSSFISVKTEFYDLDGLSWADSCDELVRRIQCRCYPTLRRSDIVRLSHLDRHMFWAIQLHAKPLRAL